jgi:hypothetical protein
MTMLEKVARALAVQAGCNPDDPAFVRYPSGEAFGVCWRDKFLEPARAALLSLKEVDGGTVGAMLPDARRIAAAFVGKADAREAMTDAFRSAIDHILTGGAE